MNYVGVTMKITIKSMQCPFNFSPKPKVCIDMAYNFKGFLLLVDQGTFDLARSHPGIKLKTCPDSPLSGTAKTVSADGVVTPSPTPAITHTAPIVRSNLTVFLTPQKE